MTHSRHMIGPSCGTRSGGLTLLGGGGSSCSSAAAAWRWRSFLAARRAPLLRPRLQLAAWLTSGARSCRFPFLMARCTGSHRAYSSSASSRRMSSALAVPYWMLYSLARSVASSSLLNRKGSAAHGPGSCCPLSWAVATDGCGGGAALLWLLVPPTSQSAEKCTLAPAGIDPTISLIPWACCSCC